MATYAAEYERAVPKLQDELSRARLQVAAPLLPLAMHVLRLSDPSTLREEAVLSALPSAAGAQPKPKDGADETVEQLLLPHLAAARQWVIYGFLMAPEELAAPGATELLFALLQTNFVLPVYGTDVLLPHTELDADSKTLLRWLKRKDEAKKFTASLKESKLAAYRQAGGVHATTRAVLATKLANLHAAIADSPVLLTSCLAALLACLRLAQDEVQWWALHLDACPDGIPAKVKAEVDTSRAFAPDSARALLLHSARIAVALQREKARITEEVAARLSGPARTAIVELGAALQAAAPSLPAELSAPIKLVPAQLARAVDVGVDLTGLRLNCLRFVCELAKPSGARLLESQPKIRPLARQLQAAAQLSPTVDMLETLLRRSVEPIALLCDGPKLARLLSSALQSSPADTVSLLALLRGAPDPARALQSALHELGARIDELVSALRARLHAQRSGRRTVGDAGLPMGALSHQLSALFAAIERAPPVEVGGIRVVLREWLRDRLEAIVEEAVIDMIYPRRSMEPSAPTLAASALGEFSTALAMVSPFTSLDVRAMLNTALAKLGGAVDGVPAGVVADEGEGRVVHRLNGVALSADAAAKAAEEAFRLSRSTRSRTSSRERLVSKLSKFSSRSLLDDEEACSTLLSRFRQWLKMEVQRVQRADGPTYSPARRAFVPDCLLSATEFAALAGLLGSRAMAALDETLLGLIATALEPLSAVLSRNKETLSAVALSYERTQRLEFPQGVELTGLSNVLECVRVAGVAIVARSLLHEGVRSVCAEQKPSCATSFVRGLGEQQLPDCRPAGEALPPVAAVLSGCGLVGGGVHADAPLAEAIEVSCSVGADPALWSSLPYALALTLSLSAWGSVSPSLDADAIGGTANLHCVCHAVHALLSAVDPHMPRNTGIGAADRGGSLAHRRFLEVCAHAIGQLRQFRHAGHGAKEQLLKLQAARERSIASMVLLVEKLVQLGPPLDYAELHAVIPASLVCATYAAVAQDSLALAGLRQAFADLGVDDDDLDPAAGHEHAAPAPMPAGMPTITGLKPPPDDHAGAAAPRFVSGQI